MKTSLTTISGLHDQGFHGFVSVEYLRHNNNWQIPCIPGVYMVLQDRSFADTEFLTTGTGGHFKCKNPNVSLSRLKQEWVEDTLILYIGESSNLQRRIKQLILFGQGKPVGHWGGRLVWQLAQARDLLICWKEESKEGERKYIKNELIETFKSVYGGKRPFANLQ